MYDFHSLDCWWMHCYKFATECTATNLHMIWHMNCTCTRSTLLFLYSTQSALNWCYYLGLISTDPTSIQSTEQPRSNVEGKKQMDKICHSIAELWLKLGCYAVFTHSSRWIVHGVQVAARSPEPANRTDGGTSLQTMQDLEHTVNLSGAVQQLNVQTAPSANNTTVRVREWWEQMISGQRITVWSSHEVRKFTQCNI